jgi:hypothetical protein
MSNLECQYHHQGDKLKIKFENSSLSTVIECELIEVVYGIDRQRNCYKFKILETIAYPFISNAEFILPLIFDDKVVLVDIYPYYNECPSIRCTQSVRIQALCSLVDEALPLIPVDLAIQGFN